MILFFWCVDILGTFKNIRINSLDAQPIKTARASEPNRPTRIAKISNKKPAQSEKQQPHQWNLCYARAKNKALAYCAIVCFSMKATNFVKFPIRTNVGILFLLSSLSIDHMDIWQIANSNTHICHRPIIFMIEFSRFQFFGFLPSTSVSIFDSQNSSPT